MHNLTKILVVGLLALLATTGCDSQPAGDAADNSSLISQQELLVRIDAQNAPLILDVRGEDEFAAGHIPGAVNIPHTEVSKRLAELPADKSTEIVVHCVSGKRAGLAFDNLTAAGYQNVRMLDGHFADWSAQNLPLEQGVTR
jgi:rhodanese-related sulfurtransferase